jgi:pilus assembly protein Flp/PilA
MTQLIALIDSFRNDEEGQGLAEYALILALIAIVAILALIFLGGQISGILYTVGKSVLDTDTTRRSSPSPSWGRRRSRFFQATTPKSAWPY